MPLLSARPDSDLPAHPQSPRTARREWDAAVTRAHQLLPERMDLARAMGLIQADTAQDGDCCKTCVGMLAAEHNAAEAMLAVRAFIVLPKFAPPPGRWPDSPAGKTAFEKVTRG